MSLTLHTTQGDIKIELFCEECRDACMNFLALCACGFYDGLLFHRVIPNLLIQTGDNSLKGDGGRSALGQSIDVEPTTNFDERGIIAYAETDSVRSQFFITLTSQPSLNGKYCGFGHVIYGFNNVQSIGRIPTLEDNYPIRAIRINYVTIHANPFAE